jgi:hypothetical protein
MKWFYAFGFVLVLLIAYGAGREWKLKPETRENHSLYRGEIAVLVHASHADVWLARDKDDCSALNFAMAKHDEERLRGCLENQTAFPVAAGTFVKVQGSSVNRKLVAVLDGSLAGREGWVEFQYLRPRRAGEFR